MIVGNLDPVAAVFRPNPEAIRQHVPACHKSAGNPFMVNDGCGIPSGTPMANLRVLCQPVPYQTG